MSADDPLRTIRLMWDPPDEAVATRRRLSLASVVTAAVDLADREGLESLSMRKLARALDAGTMSLYGYVASKSELLELMLDHVYAGFVRPDPELGWRAQVELIALADWELYHRHPWILHTNLWRLALGPNVMDASESMYQALEALGLKAAEINHTAHLIGAYVQGAARNTTLELQTQAATGESTEDYYAARMDFWEKYFDPARYPATTRIWEQGGFDDATNEFRFGLDRLLDGIELLTRERDVD